MFCIGLFAITACGNKKDIYIEKNADRFFVAYFVKEKKTADFDQVVVQIQQDFTQWGIDVETKIYEYGTNNFKVDFKEHQFDFSYMEQFEPRNGFWFHQTGKEPIDFGLDEYPDFLKVVKDYFNE